MNLHRVLHQDLPETLLDAYAELANPQSSIYQREEQSTVSATLPGEPEVVKRINTTSPFTVTSQIHNLQYNLEEERKRIWL